MSQHPIGIIPGEVVWSLDRLSPVSAPWTKGVLRTPSGNLDTAELAWEGNRPDVSCIEPGKYHVVPHPTEPQWKLRLRGVPGRSEINVETFNWPEGGPEHVAPESRGCIAPGLTYDDHGVLHSREAMKQALRWARQVWHAGASLYLSVGWTEDCGEEVVYGWPQSIEPGRLAPTTTTTKEGSTMDLLSHRTILRKAADELLPAAVRPEADALIDVATGVYAAVRDAESGNVEGAVKDVEPLISEIDKLIAEAGPGISKAWHDVVEHLRGHHHA